MAKLRSLLKQISHTGAHTQSYSSHWVQKVFVPYIWLPHINTHLFIMIKHIGGKNGRNSKALIHVGRIDLNRLPVLIITHLYYVCFIYSISYFMLYLYFIQIFWSTMTFSSKTIFINPFIKIRTIRLIGCMVNWNKMKLTDFTKCMTYNKITSNPWMADGWIQNGCTKYRKWTCTLMSQLIAILHGHVAIVDKHFRITVFVYATQWIIRFGATTRTRFFIVFGWIWLVMLW